MTKPGTSSSNASSTPSIPEHKYRFAEGEKIDNRYQVIEPLGFGGFSEVYHCEHLGLGRPVAVKVLTEKGTGLEEALIAARLEKHSHIVYVRDVLTLGDGTPFIVFDYIEGETLEACLNREHRLPLNEDSLRIVQQTAEALDYAHQQNVTHRDIKPSNIILDRRGNAYLTDFGLADVKRPRGTESERVSMVMTSEKMSEDVQRRLSGTIPYMAPEQLKGETLGNAFSDLYSLGVVTYEMLTGQLPHRGHAASLIYQITSSEPTLPTLVNSTLPRGVELVLLRALNKSPDQRYTTCTAFAQALEQASQSYVTARDQYETAMKLFEAQQWRKALAAFQTLEQQSPGFRDTAHYLGQTRHQVQLSQLYEQAQNTLEQKRYQEALDILKSLTQLEPNYEGVNDLRLQAFAGLAQEAKHSLDKQYQQAIQQFEKGEYQACLDTLAAIRQRDPKYPDAKGIEGIARKQVQLHERYDKGLEQIRLGKWQEAVVTFEELKRDAPAYEGVESQLASARYLARMAHLLQEARTLLEQEDFTLCMKRLDELQQLDKEYEQDGVARLRQDVVDALYKRARRLSQEGKFDEGQDSLVELRQLLSTYAGLEEPPGLKELESQNKEGTRVLTLRAQLDHMHRQAIVHLNRREYAQALDLCHQIEQQRGDVKYADLKQIESQARAAYSAQLYAQAWGALAQQNPQQTLEWWRQVRGVDPDYPDTQQVEKHARAMIAQQEKQAQMMTVRGERNKKIRKWAIIVGGSILALVLLITAVVAAIKRFPSPSPTQTGVAMVATAIPTPSKTPTPTPSETPAPIPTLPAPANIATATQGASIYAAPDVNSQVLGSVSRGQTVPVFGCSANGNWLYVRNAQNVEGFVYKARFTWTENCDSLPVKTPLAVAPARTPTATPGGSWPLLAINLWQNNGTEVCQAGGPWSISVTIGGLGGNGAYTYYWQGEKKAGPMAESYAFVVSSSSSGAIVGTGRVISGDGQTAEAGLYIPSPCSP